MKILPVILAWLLLAPAFGTPVPLMPDPKLTPGAVLDGDVAIVCAPGYARSHRVWQDKAGTLTKYGIPLADADQ
jgi:hypothetical protein